MRDERSGESLCEKNNIGQPSSLVDSDLALRLPRSEPRSGFKPSSHGRRVYPTALVQHVRFFRTRALRVLPQTRVGFNSKLGLLDGG